MHLRLASRPPLRPSRIGDLLSLTSKNGGEIIWQGLTPEVSLPAPQKGWPEDVPDFVRPGIPSVPLCLARFKQVRIFGPSVAVASTDGTLFKDVSVEWNSNPEPWPMRRNILPFSFRCFAPARLGAKSRLGSAQDPSFYRQRPPSRVCSPAFTESGSPAGSLH